MSEMPYSVVAGGLETSTVQGADVAQALAVALENQPDYLTSLLPIERAKINLDYAKNQRLWDVSLVRQAVIMVSAIKSTQITSALHK